ncbi:hypothetical protein N0V82_008214 [Gnomoniopsis sp. IMI 355080]|nr:hypothetical protein N0V82_008214 [Gnomoniopsis sp. IMI 355080]
MLCQRCASLFRATAPAVSKSQPARRAVSTSSRLQQPATVLSTATTPRPFQPQATQPLSTVSKFHTSIASHSPASSAAESASSAAAKPVEKPDFLDEAESVIWDRLAKEFSPVELVVQDISGGCGSMYGIEISSERFRGANMLKQQRMVNAVLGDLLKGWHGCQLKTRVP